MANPFKSFRGKLLLFTLCVTLLPVAIVTTVEYLNARRIVLKQSSDWLASIAEAKKLRIESFLDEKMGRAIAFSSDKFIIDRLEKIHGYRDLADLNRYLVSVKKPLDNSIIEIAVVDRDGKVVSATSSAMIGIDMSDTDVFKQTMVGGTSGDKISFDETVLSVFVGPKTMLACSPIKSKENGDIIGLLINAYDLIAPLDELVYQPVGETGETYMVENKSKLMLTGSRFVEFSHLTTVADTEPVRRILRGSGEMVDIYRDYRGVPVLGASAYIPEAGWTVLAEINKAEALAPLRFLTISALGLAFLSAAVAASVGVMFAVSIVKPLRELKGVKERFAAGDLTARAKITSRDEIGELARSFNIMAETIEDDIEEIQKNRDLLNDTLGNMGCLVRVIDVENHKVILQNKPLQALSPQGLERPCYTFWGRDTVCDLCICREAIEKNRYSHKEVETPEGVLYEVHGFPFANPDGTITNAIEVIRDVTARRKMEEDLEESRMQLLQAQKMSAIGHLSSGIAHTINNPLSGINMYADVLLKKIEEVKEASIYAELKSYLTEMKEASRRCSTVVKDLLSISRIPKPEKLPVYINDAVEHVLSVTSPQLKLLRIQLIKELSPTAPRILGSHNQLETVFMNIVSNAIDAMPEGGTLTIKTRYLSSEGKVEITFADTGCGINKKDIPYIFNPYFTTKPTGKGTGLGLSIAQMTVHSHRGNMEVDSEVGRGTTFKIKLPVYRESLRLERNKQ